LLPPDAVTVHAINIEGRRHEYVAVAGTLPLIDQNGEPSAAIFYTAYSLKDAARETRPLTFVFNGGPGASSAYLHLGLVGPQVVEFSPGPDGAGARLQSNPHPWLSFTDLVLIDPVGTGWSRAARGDGAPFWGVRQDAQALAKAIALYLARSGRTFSPKYLVGESYGSFRAVKIARALQREQGVIVNGIVMVSPFLEGALLFGANRFALGAALQLPSLAAAELDRRNRFSEEALQAAERFAMTEYLTTLAGRPPDEESGRAFYARLAEITGLPLDTVVRSRGFVREAYMKRRREGRLVSPYDGAFAGLDPYPESDAVEGSDPILDGFVQVLSSLFVGYARDQLGFKTDMTYILLNREVSGKWDWGGSPRSIASATRDMRELLALNPSLRIHAVHGRSDLVTPYAVTRYILDHLPPTLTADRTALTIYRGGHMFYLDPESRAAFTRDIGAFFRNKGS
jgi:carboxypeptidase C (cathepsin A)